MFHHPNDKICMVVNTEYQENHRYKKTFFPKVAGLKIRPHSNKEKQLLLFSSKF